MVKQKCFSRLARELLAEIIRLTNQHQNADDKLINANQTPDKCECSGGDTLEWQDFFFSLGVQVLYLYRTFSELTA